MTRARVILTAAQTADVIRQAGGESHCGRVFAVAHPGSYPTAPGRLVLDLIGAPSIKHANDALDVLYGKARAIRFRKKPADSRKEAGDA